MDKANKNLHSCLGRASQYHRWCGNDSSEKITASYYLKGDKVETLSSDTPYQGCFISQASCKKHPQYAGTFYDNYDNSSADKKRCMKRAADYHKYCGNDSEVTTRAEFYKKGNVKKSTEFSGDSKH